MKPEEKKSAGKSLRDELISELRAGRGNLLTQSEVTRVLDFLVEDFIKRCKNKKG